MQQFSVFNKNEKRTGDWKNYHKNGQLSMNGTFINGKETGVWKWYDENGVETDTATYKGGVLIEE